MTANPAAPAHTAFVAALELLTRSWNPPHRPPRMIKLEPQSSGSMHHPRLPNSLGDAALHGTYLRGMDLQSLRARPSTLKNCDLRGARLSNDLPLIAPDNYFSLASRLASATNQSSNLSLQAQILGSPTADDQIAHLWINNNCTTILAGHKNGTIQIYSALDSRIIRNTGIIEKNLPHSCIAVESHDFNITIATIDRESIRLWRLNEAGEPLQFSQVLDGRWSKTKKIALSGNGKLLLISQADTLKLWTIDPSGNSKKITEKDIESSEIKSISIDYDGTVLVSMSAYRIIYIWALEARHTLRQTEKLEEFSAQLTAIALSADGKYLATCHVDNSILIWEIRLDGSARKKHTIRAITLPENNARDIHNIFISAAQLNANGTVLVGINNVGEIYTWRFNLLTETYEYDNFLDGDNVLLRPLSEMLSSRDKKQGTETYCRPSINSAGDSLAMADSNGFIHIWKQSESIDSRNYWQRESSAGNQLSIHHRQQEDAWQLARSDGQPWQTVADPHSGKRLPADPVLYPWLWFTDAEHRTYPAFDVPPDWLEWSADYRTLTVAKAPHAPEELSTWLQALNGKTETSGE